MIRKALHYLFEKLIVVILFLGVIWGIVVVVSLASHLFDETYPKIAHGTKYLLFTLLLFFGFTIWQYIEIRRWFAPNANNITFIITRVLFWLSMIFAFIVLILDVVGFYGPEWLKPYGTNNTFIFPSQENSSLFTILFNSFVDAGFIAGLTFAGLSLFLRFGIFTSGLSFCVALHNYFNGMSFDLSSFYNMCFEITLPEIWGIIFTIGQFLISTFIAYKIGIDT